MDFSHSSQELRIVVVGATGLLGSELCRQLPGAVPLSRPRIDLTQPETILRSLKEARPNVVINTAAYTNVDRAERESGLCCAVNVTGVGHLVDACKQLGCALVQLSSDYVFGDHAGHSTPYVETDTMAPRGVYAESKMLAEEFARRLDNHLIVRVCGLYGGAGPGTQKDNFVDTMLKLGRQREHVRVIDDQTSSPSYVTHVARAIKFLTEKEAVGTYHVVNAGKATWHDLASEVFRVAGLNVWVDRISTEEYGLPAPRPRYSVLDTSKYRSLGGPPLATWREALAEYLSSRPLTQPTADKPSDRVHGHKAGIKSAA